jgi:HK97 family phage portal protein
MNLLQRVAGLFGEKRSSDAAMYSLVSDGIPTLAGPPVNEVSAMRSSAVYACIRIISESIAALPLVIYKQDGRDKQKAVTHPLYPVLHNLANSDMTAFEWRELAMSHVLAWGNHWSRIERDKSSGIIERLEPLNPARMEGYEWRENDLWWKYREGDNTITYLEAGNVHHIKGLGNGIEGISPIRQAAKQAIGLSLAAEEFGARFYSNGARPGLILRHPGKLSDAAATRLKASFASEHQGLSNSHRTKILEEGMDISTIGIPPNEAQFLETRKFQVTEIARIYRVPPHMLADLDRATFSNIEQQSINFVVYTLMPWLVRHEQAIYRDLLSEPERKIYFAKYVVEGMLRGDALARYQSYQIAVNNTILTPNEIRELEDRNPVEGGDVLFQPMNMMELGALPPQPTAPAPVRSEWREVEPLQIEAIPAVAATLVEHEARAVKASADRRALINRNVRLFEEAAARAVKREVHNIRQATKSKLGTRNAASFESWLEEFYKQLRAWFPDYFRNIMLTYAESIMASVAAELGGEPAPLDDTLREWIAGYLANYTEVYAVGGEKQLRAILAESQGDEAAEKAINERMDGWEETKAQKEGFEQAFEAGNALAIFGYTAANVSFLRWNATGKSCPLCRDMDGKRIKVGGAFFEEGDTHTAEGAEPLPIVRTIKHGPLHRGCDCLTVAG